METSNLLAIAATTGGVILGVSPVLQIRLIVARQTSAGVSVGYWLTLAAAMGLWLAYGVSINNVGIMVANTVSIVFALAMVAVALAYRPRPLAPPAV